MATRRRAAGPSEPGATARAGGADGCEPGAGAPPRWIGKCAADGRPRQRGVRRHPARARPHGTSEAVGRSPPAASAATGAVTGPLPDSGRPRRVRRVRGTPRGSSAPPGDPLRDARWRRPNRTREARLDTGRASPARGSSCPAEHRGRSHRHRRSVGPWAGTAPCSTEATPRDRGRAADTEPLPRCPEASPPRPFVEILQAADANRQQVTRRQRSASRHRRCGDSAERRARRARRWSPSSRAQSATPTASHHLTDWPAGSLPRRRQRQL